MKFLMTIILISFQGLSFASIQNTREHYVDEGVLTSMSADRSVLYIRFDESSYDHGNLLPIHRKLINRLGGDPIFHHPARAIELRVDEIVLADLEKYNKLVSKFNNMDGVVSVQPRYVQNQVKVFLDNRMIYGIKNGCDKSHISRILKSYGAVILEEIQLGDSKQIIAELLNKKKDISDLSKAIFKTKEVTFAHPVFTNKVETYSDPLVRNYKIDNTEPNDPYLDSQWYLHNTTPGKKDKDIDAINAWKLTKGDSRVVVAILEPGGYQVEHPDLIRTITSPYNAIKNNDEVTPAEKDNHGTATIGMISPETNNNKGIAGIGYGIRVIPITMGHRDSSGNIITSDVYVARAAAKVILTENVVAVSNAWGNKAEPSKSVKNSVIQMRKFSRGGIGAVVMFSSGNDGDDKVSKEGGITGVISVGATDKDDKRTSFSNYGKKLDLVAPGKLVLTTDRTTKSKGYCNDPATKGVNKICKYSSGNYVFANGTSFSVSLVAGVLGLVASVNPLIKRETLDAIIKITAEKIGDIPYQVTKKRTFGTWNEYYGYGRINAYAAVQAAHPDYSNPVLNSINITQRLYRVGRESITIEDEVNVKKDGNLLLLAGQKIEFKAGFKVELGGKLNARINTKLKGLEL